MRFLSLFPVSLSILLVESTPCIGYVYNEGFVTDEHNNRAISSEIIPQVVRDDNEATSRSEGWICIGPFGGDVYDVNVSPIDADIVLAGIAPEGYVDGTLYRSSNCADIWSEVPSLSGISVYDIEYTPDGIVYIGTEDGVWKSINHGMSFTQLDIGFELYDTVYEISIDPDNAHNIWAGGYFYNDSNYKHVTLSTNDGITWNDLTPPMSSPMSCKGITFDPNNTNKVYACFGGWSGGEAFWTSTDYGNSWTDRSTGLPNSPLTDVVHDGSRLLVTGGQRFASQDVGLYESTDEGITWTALHDGSWPILAFSDIELDPNDANTIYLASLGAGAYQSTDGGTTWTFGVGNTSGLSLNAVRFSPESSSVIFLGANSIGTLKSTDGGSIFAPSAHGINMLQVTSIAANPNNINELAIAFKSLNSGGVYTSLDVGQTWILEPVPGTRWSAVSFHSNGTLYAISDGPTTIADEGLYRRNEDSTWTSLGPDQGPSFESQLLTMRFSLNHPSLFLLGGSDFGSYAGCEATIWRSIDAGITWYKVYEGPETCETVTDIEIVENGTDTLMIASFWDDMDPQVGGGVLRSTDGGDTWFDSSTGLDPETQGYAIGVSPMNLNIFYYADGDYGNGGLFKSTDTGETWSNTGFEDRVYDVVCDQTDDQVIYIIQPTSEKVSKSTDGGETFLPFNSGLEHSGVGKELTYTIGYNPRLLLASTAGSYMCDVGVGINDGGAYSPLLPKSFKLSKNFPNPFNPSTTIEYTIPEKSGIVRTELCIYDLRGRLVKWLFKGEQGPGSYRLHWDGRDNNGQQSSSGIYLYTIKAGYFESKRKMVLIK